VKRGVFEAVGRFSEDYFMYAEDIDLCYKIRRAGFKSYYVPDATVIHHGGSSTQQALSNFSIIMMREAIWRFLRKTRGGPYGWGYRMAMLTSALGRLAALCLTLPWRKPPRRSVSRDASFRKWLAVLRWSLHREGWVKQYYPLG
jgi:GT2 family glycosyltransferase